MDDVRLWGVEGLRPMANILRGVEYAKCKTIQKFTLGQESTYRLEAPACSRLQESWNIFKLGNIVATEANLFLKLFDCPVKLFAGVCLEQFDEIGVAKVPGFNLIFGILKSWNRLMYHIACRSVVDFLTTLSVGHVAEARMICVLDAVSFGQNALSN